MELWKFLALDYIKKYKNLETSIPFLKNRISTLTEQMDTTSMSFDNIKVSGSGYSAEDKYINIIAEKNELEKKLNANIAEYNAIKAVFESLSEDDQQVLHIAYIDRNKYHIEKIMDKFCVEKSRAYELKEKALKNLILALFG